MTNKQVAKKNRTQVITMVIAFPLLVAFGVYSLIWLAGRDTLFQTTNRGEFVDPPVLARELGLRDESGAPVDGSGTWWVWLVTPDCAAACERSLEDLGGLGRRLHDQAHRVRQALVTGRAPSSLPAPDHHPQMPRFTSDGEKTLEEGIYLVDSAGNVVLKYPFETRSQPILEDLVRLLEVPEDA